MQESDNQERSNQETKSNSGGSSSHNEESFFEDSDLDANYTESESNTSESDLEETVERGRVVRRTRNSYSQRNRNALRNQHGSRGNYQHRRVESIPESAHTSIPIGSIGDYQPQWSSSLWSREQREIPYCSPQYHNSNEEVVMQDLENNVSYIHNGDTSETELGVSNNRGHTRHMSLGDTSRGYFPTDESYDFTEHSSDQQLHYSSENERWDSFSPDRGYAPVSGLNSARQANHVHSHVGSLENTVANLEYRGAGHARNVSRNSVEGNFWESSRNNSRSSGSLPALAPLVTHRTYNSLSTLKQQDVLEQFPSLTGHIDLPPDGPGQRVPQRQPAAGNRVSTAAWEEEGTLCIVVELSGTAVTRRCDNNMINGTKLLNSAQISRGRRDGVLKGETVRHVVKVGVMDYKGVWIPFERALEMAKREKVLDDLYPLFVADLTPILYSSQNYARLRQIVSKANRRNPIFQQWLNGIPKQGPTKKALPETHNGVTHSQSDTSLDRSSAMPVISEYGSSHTHHHSQNRAYRGPTGYERHGHSNTPQYDAYGSYQVAYGGMQYNSNNHNAAAYRHQRARSQDTSHPHHEFPNHFQGPYHTPSNDKSHHESPYDNHQDL